MEDDSYVEAWDERLFLPHDPNKSSKKIEDKSFVEVLTQSQIDSRLDLARSLARKGIPMKSRDQALRLVSMLIRDNPIIVEFVCSKLDPRYHEILNSKIAECRQLDSTAQFSNSNEEIYLKCVNRILEILKSHQIEIPADVDDFMLKLTCDDKSRNEIFKKIPDKNDQKKIARLCKILLDNELKIKNEGVLEHGNQNQR